MLLFVLLLLSGCAAAPGENPPSPTPPVLDAPEVQAQGALADAARAMLSVYENELNIVAPLSRNHLTYTIPGDVISKMAQDAQEVGAQAQAGRYQFTWRKSGEYTYSLSGLEVQEEMAAEPTPLPGGEPDDMPMDSQQTGDFMAEGGGLFERVCVYDAAEDLSLGTAQITDTLNGEITGQESFSFAVRGGDLYFVDTAKDVTAGLDGLEDRGMYLVAAGVLRRDGLEIIEYYIHDPAQAPLAADMDWDQVRSSVTPVSRIYAQGSNVQLSP